MNTNPQDATLGMNRTGMDMAPRLGKEMQENSRDTVPSSTGSAQDGDDLRADYILGASAVGSVPAPGTVKGVVKTVAKKLTGDKPEVLVDKLGERLAFERTGVRLYELLINKCGALAGGAPFQPQLKQFQYEEGQHFVLVRRCLEELGADPTAVTPGADTVGVATTGLLQVLSDPRTSVEQCLQALLVAELADNDGWQLLAELAEALGQDAMAQDFQRALTEEELHLQHVRSWLNERVRASAGVPLAPIHP